MMTVSYSMHACTFAVLWCHFDVAHWITAIGIRFEESSYLYLENAGTSMVCALLEGEADREIVVTFESANGLAQGLLACHC